MSLKLFLGAESLAPKASGIGRVARLIARVLDEQSQKGNLRISAQTLNEPAAQDEFGFSITSAHGSRAQFVGRTYLTCLSHSAAIYDHLGIARAHLTLPIARRPFLSYIHGTEVWETAPQHRITWARIADCLVANSQYTRERAERCHRGFSRAHVCWLATESDTAPNRQQNNGPPTVLIAGRIDWPCYKGHTELIKVWPRVTDAIPAAQLLIVGGGSGLEPLRKEVAKLSCAENITITGFIAEDQIERIWTRTNVFAMPSRGEGFGLVYAEAMRHGLPVIGSIYDAAVEVNIDGVTGFNVGLDNLDDLADRIIFLLKNPDTAARIGAEGQKRWTNHFRFSAFRDRFLPILSEFLEKAA